MTVSDVQLLLTRFSMIDLPLITITVFAVLLTLRLTKWYMAWKYAQPLGSPGAVKGSRISGIILNWTINLTPPRDLPARLEPGFYFVGLTMHLSFIAILLLTKSHITVITGWLKYLGIPISINVNMFLQRPYTHIISALLLASITVMFARRVYHYATKSPLRGLIGSGEFIATPFILVIGLTGLLAALRVLPEPFTQYLVISHVILVQLFIIYVPASKFIHGISAFIVRTLSGVKRGRLGV